MSGYGTATNDIHPRLSSAEVMVNLRKENERLRELVRDTIPYVDCLLGSDECVHLHECHGGNGCVFEMLAHELGVEV